MKTLKFKNSAHIISSIFVLFLILWGSADANAQRKNIIEEDFVSFSYDNNNPVEVYSFVSIEKMENDEIERKEYHYGNILPNGIGLPSIEKVDVNRCREIYDSLESHLIKEDNNNDNAHLIKFEGDNDTAYLINPDWDGHWSGYLTNEPLAHLVNPNWDGHNA